MNHAVRNAASCLGGALSIAAILAAPPALAFDDIVTLDIGAYRFNAKTNVAASATGQRGNVFRIEDEGTPDSDTILRLDGTVRPFARHRVRFMYLQSTRGGSATSGREIRFQDSVIPAGTSISTEFSLRQAELAYLYSFWKTETTELALSLGVHATRMEASLNAPSLGVSRVASATGPLPMIGLAATTRLGQKWELIGQVYGIKAEVDNVEGSAVAYRAGVRYFITPHVGVGLAAAGVRFNVDLEKSRWRGELDASNNGAQVFLTVRF